MANRLLTVGWREWVALPTLGLPAIKTKVDTGARTSCLHAYDVKPFTKDGEKWLRFSVHPLQNNQRTVQCEAPLADKRLVTDSGGHRELRYVIATELTIGEFKYPIELTLTNRDQMRFKMLLGREALKKRLLVNPGKSFLLGRLKASAAERIYHT